jgi:4-amino-4-deoxy-L-arabinose transferase-like glycosyltransferase
VIQQIAGINRYQKPPFISWMIAVAMKVTGSQAEWVARMPSLLCGLGTVWIMAAITAAHFGRWVGVTAGVMQGTVFYVVMQSRLCEIDSALCFAITSAMGAFWWAHVRPGRIARFGSVGWWVASGVLHLMTAVAFLLKGPLGPPVVYGAGTVFAVWRRDKSAFWFIWNPLIVVGLNVMASWPLAAYFTSPDILKCWWAEVVDRTTGTLGRVEPVYFYFYTAPMLLLPWAPLAAVGVIKAVRTGWLGRKGAPLGTFLAAWFGTGFVILSCTAWKHKHYLIPMMPALTPACAAGLVLYLRWQYGQRPRGYAIVAGVWLLVCAGGVAVVWKYVGRYEVRLTVIIGLLALGGLATLVAERRRWLMWQLSFTALTAGGVITLTNRFLTPAFDVYWPYAELGKRASADAPADATLRIVNLRQAHISYYLRVPFRRIDSISDEGITFEQGRAYGIIPREKLPELAKFGRVTELDAAGVQTLKSRPEDALVYFRLDENGVPAAAASQPAR